MEGENNSIWANINPEQNTTHSEINEIVKTIRTRKEITLKQINNEELDKKNNLNKQNTSTTTLNDYQEIFGLITPFIIALTLFVLFPPCLMWCSESSQPSTFVILLFCNLLAINFGYAFSAPRFSKGVIAGALPLSALAFYVWETFLL